jgi:hypothetical protein
METLAPRLGHGNDSCADWLMHHRNNDAESRIEDEWLSGYFSGYNRFVIGWRKHRFILYGEEGTLPGTISSICLSEDNLTVGAAADFFISTAHLAPPKIMHPYSSRRD